MKIFQRLVALTLLLMSDSLFGAGDEFLAREEIAVRAEFAKAADAMAKGKPSGKVDDITLTRIHLLLESYGEFFSPRVFEDGMKIYLQVKNHEEANLELTKILAKWLKRGGRKSAMTVLNVIKSVDRSDAEKLTEIAVLADGESWLHYRDSQEYQDCAAMFIANGDLNVDGDALAGDERVMIRKVKVGGAEESLAVDLGMGYGVTFSQGRASFQGCLAETCQGSFFTKFEPQPQKPNPRAVLVMDQGFGKSGMRWQDGENRGLIQFIKAEKGHAFLMTSQGEPKVSLTLSLGSLAEEDKEILALRGRSLMNEVARQIAASMELRALLHYGKYADPELFRRKLSGSWDDVTARRIALLYASTLPPFTEPKTEGEKGFNSVIDRFK